MTLALNGTTATGVYLNGTKIDKAYLNGTEVYSSYTPTHTLTVGYKSYAGSDWYGYDTGYAGLYGALSPTTLNGRTIESLLVRLAPDNFIQVRGIGLLPGNITITLPSGSSISVVPNTSYASPAEFLNYFSANNGLSVPIRLIQA